MIKPFTIFKTLTVLFLLSLNTPLYAQTGLKAAWTAFFENKRAEAKELFLKATQQTESAAEAQLALSLLAQVDDNAPVAFENFKKFYTQTQNPQPYLYALWTSLSVNRNFGKKSPEQLTFLRELTQKDFDGTLTAMAYTMIGQHYLKNKKAALGDKELINVGSVDNWAITGEFQNISTSGFDKTYATLSNAQDTSSFKNRNGVSIAWHTVPYLRHDKWFDFTYYADPYNAILFAQSFVKSDTEREVQLRVGVSGSIKLWVNDKLILTEAEERNNDLDSYIQTIKLHQGYNRLLIQIGESYADASNFLVRITDNKGRVIPGLIATAKYQPYTKEETYVSIPVEHFAVDYFKNKVAANADDVLSRIMLAQTYINLDKTFEARTIIEPLTSQYPNNTFLNTMLLRLFGKTSNRTGEQTVAETIKMSDADSYLGIALKYDELYEQKQYEKAGDLLKKMETLYPHEGEYVYNARLDIANNTDNQKDYIKYADEAYTKYPDNRTFVSGKYFVENNIRKNASKGIELLKKYVDNNDNYGAAKDLAEAYFDAGKAAAGIKVYQDEISFDPVGVGIYSKLAGEYYSQEQYAKAAELYLKCIEISPTGANYFISLAQVYEASSQKDKAIQYYQKGLQLNPTDYEAIKSLRKIQGKKAVFDYFTEPDIATIVKNGPKASDYPEFNYAILNQETQRVVYENGGSEDRRFLTVKIFNQKGIDTFKEYTVNAGGDDETLIETAEVIKVNGTKTPAEKNDNQIVFTNLEAGDVINIKYKNEKYLKGDLAPHFWDTFYFTQGCPAVSFKYSLLIDKKKNFEHKFSQFKINEQKNSADEFDLYVWKTENVKGILYEDKLPAFADIANSLTLSSVSNWKFISNWYNDLASAKARSNYEVKSVVNSLFQNTNKLTDMQKIETIYHYITSNISYSSVSFRQSGIVPQNPSTVINTRIGDCKDVSTLFVAMCKEAGIKAQLVLVKTRPYGLKSLSLPSIEFNHCIAKVNVEGKEYYIELTSKYLPFRAISTPYVNSTILDIGNTEVMAGIKYLNPATRKQNNVFRTSTLTFKDKDMLVDENIEMVAAMAGAMRQFYLDLSPSDRVKKTKEAFNRLYSDVEVNKMDFVNLEQTDKDTVQIKMNYELRNMAKEIAGLNIFSLPWSDKFAASTLQITLPRANGIDLSQIFSMDAETETFIVNLPAGKNLVENPLNVSVSNDFLDYSIASAVKGRQLVITRKLKFKENSIPAEKAAELKDIFKKIVETDNKELALK